MAGRYTAYPEYKDSGVEWLGEIPKHWNTMQLKRTIDRCTNGIWGSEPKKDGNDTIVIRVADFDRDKLLIKDNGYTFRRIEKSEKLSRKISQGDLLLEKSGGGEKTLVGQVVLFNKTFDAVTSNFVAKMTPKENFDSHFLNYVFSKLYSDDINYCSIKQNTGIQNLDSNSYLMEKFGFPCINEQQKIANFLDHETAKIDTLIEKQQQLIKLLKEKRQAVISHAVTKGLNPNVPMRDSGVEWLGEVPEHWQIKRLRYIGTCQNGINIGAEFFGSGYPFVSYGDVYRNEVLPKTVNGLVQSSKADRKIYSIIKGDILFTRTSETVDEVGFSSACLKNLEDASFAGFLIRFRPYQNLLDINFSRYYFRNTLLRMFFVKEMNLVTRASLSQDLLKRLPVPLPPLEEQRQISVYLDKRSSIFSKLTGNAESAILLLKERRTALISAAVTGKIDLRNWQAPVSHK